MERTPLDASGLAVGAVDVSVVLPIYNEADHLLAELERVRSGFAGSGLTHEIIAIDDGSTDGSAELLAEQVRAGAQDLHVVGMARNGGAGTARRIGTSVARGDVVVWTDVDMTYPNDEIPQLVAQMSGADHVVGARRTEEGTHKLVRSPAKWALRQLAQVLTGERIPDLNSGFRAFRRDVAAQYLHLLPAGFSCVTTMTLAFLSNGYSVRYVPIDYAPRAGESKFHWFTDSRRYLLQIVRMVLMHEPLRIIGPVGVLLLLAGLGKLAYDAITDPIAIAINTLVILAVAGVVLGLGLLADLFVRLTGPGARVLPAARLTSAGAPWPSPTAQVVAREAPRVPTGG